MEAIDISKLIYELMRSKEDRMCMDYEDKASQAMREIYKLRKSNDYRKKQMLNLSAQFKELCKTASRSREQSKQDVNRLKVSSKKRATGNVLSTTGIKRRIIHDNSSIVISRKKGENDDKHSHKDSISAEKENFGEHASCIENLLHDVNMPVCANHTEIPFEKKVIDDDSKESNGTKTVSTLKRTEKIDTKERKDLFLTKDTDAYFGLKDGNRMGIASLVSHQMCLDMKPYKSDFLKSSGPGQSRALKHKGQRNHTVGAIDYQPKCIEVVRNKEQRSNLPGYSCTECEKWFEAMEQQGIIKKGERFEMLRDCSRHKSKATPPTTPEGFWSISLHTPDDWQK